MEIVVVLFSVLLILSTIASLIKWDDWWIRIFDFPRIQISVLILLFLFASVIFYDWTLMYPFVLTGLLICSLIYQGRRIFIYTPLFKKQVRKYKGQDTSNSLSLIISNVLTPNRGADKLVKLVNSEKPQILLTLESDQWWEDQLIQIEKDYPYSIKMPLDNLYGIHFYSNLKILEFKINYLIQEDIPSIEALIELTSGEKVRIFCLHPMPPSPTESDTSTDRDAEILLVGKRIKDIKEPVLVIGDLNDVAWSNTTRLFQRTSGLLDPRIGRGFFSTFHAKYPLLRWPLDHVFHSEEFEHIKYKRLPNIGSDHFPIYTEIYLQKNREYEKDLPSANQEEKKEAKDKILKAGVKDEEVKTSETDTKT